MYHPLGNLARHSVTPRLTYGAVRSFSTSPSVQSRRWKYLLRPDLKGEMHSKALLAKYDLSKPDQRTEYNKVLFDNHLYWWRTVDPDEICRRLNNVLATDFKRPNGGISVPIVKILLQLAKTPQHVQVALQCVTVWQHNQPAHEKKQNIERRVPTEIGKLICKAAVKVGAPEIGISWLQMPWINSHRSLASHNVLLEYYAKQAESHFLLRKAEGLSGKTPESYKDRLPKDEEKKDDDDEDEDEEEEGDVDAATKAKKEKKKFNNWLANYMILVKELKDEKQYWQPNSESYAHIARFYASLGDTQQALELVNDHYSPEFSSLWDKTIASLTLALVQKGQVDKASEILKKASVSPLSKEPGSAALRRAYVALAIANKDEKAIAEVLSKFSVTQKETFSSHFGKKENVEFLLKCLEATSEQAEKAKWFMYTIRSHFLKEEEQEAGEEGEEAEEEEGDGKDKE